MIWSRSQLKIWLFLAVVTSILLKICQVHHRLTLGRQESKNSSKLKIYRLSKRITWWMWLWARTSKTRWGRSKPSNSLETSLDRNRSKVIITYRQMSRIRSLNIWVLNGIASTHAPLRVGQTQTLLNIGLSRSRTPQLRLIIFRRRRGFNTLICTILKKRITRSTLHIKLTSFCQRRLHSVRTQARLIMYSWSPW